MFRPNVLNRNTLHHKVAKPFVITLLSLSLMMVPGLVPEAHADHDRSWLAFGTSFRIGGLQFSIGLRSGGRGGDYFVRGHHPIRYRGYKCTDACYRSRDYYYHHQDCPVIRHHFSRYGFHPRQVFSAYAPRLDYGYRDGYGDRYYRDDHRPRYRGNGRYYDRGPRYRNRGPSYDRGHWNRYGRHHDHDVCLRNRRY
ncbi:MAG: hypothetical protein SX243_15075 [Acidobacteriota bacterium]|nr:hypothetical protein [Acidobacteriota bacterium]